MRVLEARAVRRAGAIPVIGTKFFIAEWSSGQLARLITWRS